MGLNKVITFFGDETLVLQDKTIEFYGDSITYGLLSSDNAHRWTTLATNLVGGVENNHGISGEVLQNVATETGQTIFNYTTTATYNKSIHGALVIVLGTNDIGINNGSFTVAGYKARLISALEYIHVYRNWPYRNIILGTPYYMTTTGYATYVGSNGVTSPADIARHEAYVEAVQQVATLKHTCYVDFYAAMKNSADPASLIGWDGIHPNDTGHAFVANTFNNNSFLPL